MALLASNTPCRSNWTGKVLYEPSKASYGLDFRWNTLNIRIGMSWSLYSTMRPYLASFEDRQKHVCLA